MHLGTTLAGIKLEHPLMNAGGTCKTVEQFERFARSAVSAIVVGPITPLPRKINPGNVYWQGLLYSLNSLGMPNVGKEQFFAEDWPRIREIAEESGKPVILQVAGFNSQDYWEVARLAEQCGVNKIELNFGCPNVWDGGRQKGIVSFDPWAIEHYAEAVRDIFSGIVGLKLSPYSDPALLAEVAQVINKLQIDYVALSNTFPNAMVLGDDGRPVITPADGLAGLSGSVMKPIALGQVYQFVMLLEEIDIVGVGGIATGQDIVDFLRAGATAVQASTIFWNANEDPGVYSDVLADYVDVMGALEASGITVRGEE